MNKADLIDLVAQAADISKNAASQAVETLVDEIKKSLIKGDAVTLVGFGTFVVRERKARTGRNPKTGETLQIKASRAAGFKPGKSLKDALQEGRH